MRRFLPFILFIVLLTAAIIIAAFYYGAPQLQPVFSTQVTEYHRILDKYTFARLRAKIRTPSEIVIGKALKTDFAFTAYLFTFVSDGKTISGQLNIPTNGDNLPVIVMMRGYVDKEIYYTGLGTRTASEAFARAGYITLAPDFLGYGNSDPESTDILEARFEKPATVLNLIASLATLSKANPDKVGLWGHSNGGQITLSILEISQLPYPTVLWAPVTQSFPASILQYVDELPDKGTYIQGKLGEFNERYTDIEYDIASHWKEITASLQVHQGSYDELVPEAYTATFVDTLKDHGVDATYFIYPKENHNFTNGSVTAILQRDLEFFASHLR